MVPSTAPYLRAISGNTAFAFLSVAMLNSAGENFAKYVLWGFLNVLYVRPYATALKQTNANNISGALDQKVG